MEECIMLGRNFCERRGCPHLIKDPVLIKQGIQTDKMVCDLSGKKYRVRNYHYQPGHMKKCPLVEVA